MAVIQDESSLAMECDSLLHRVHGFFSFCFNAVCGCHPEGSIAGVPFCAFVLSTALGMLHPVPVTPSGP